jgi:hypothetical protein
MGEEGMSNKFPVDSTGFNNADQLPDELPADFSDFDDETPEEPPADFAAFDEDYSSGPSTPDAPPPSMPQSSTTPAAVLGSSQLLEPFPQEKRERIMAFAQALGPTVTHVVPKGTPDPVFSRDAVHERDRWRRQRDDRIFRRAREGRVPQSIYEQEQEKKEEEKREQERRKEWLHRQRQIAHGWAKYIYWLERSPQEADAYRQQHEDELGEWLVEIAGKPSFKVRPKVIASVSSKRAKPLSVPRERGMGS